MDEGFDTGPVLVQRDGIVLDEWTTPALLWSRVLPVLAEALTESLAMVADGAPGEPQGDAGASYAGFIEPEFSVIDWAAPPCRSTTRCGCWRTWGGRRSEWLTVQDCAWFALR